MTDSEIKAQKYLRNVYPSAFIRKIPDFKQTGSMLGGLPDYLIITLSGEYIWYEIKLINKNTKTINLLNLFTDQQLPIFTKMERNKANIQILIFHKKSMFIIPWMFIRNRIEMDEMKIGINKLINFEVK